MKKRILLVVAMIAMLVCVFAISVSAAEPSYKDGEWIYADDGITRLAIRDTEGNPLIWYMNGDELKWVRADITDETQSVYVKYSISAGGDGFDKNVLVPQKTLKKITIVDNGTEIAGSGSNLSAQKIVLLNLERLDIDALNGWLFGNKNGCCPLMRGLVLPSTLKGIGTEGFTNHKVVQIWNLENTQLCYIATSFSAPFGSASLTQEATNYTLKFPSTLTVLPVVQNSRVKTVIFSPNTSSQNTNRTIGDMPNLEKIFIPAAMAEVGFNAETFRSTTNILLFFTGTKEQAEQMKSKSNSAHQGHFTSDAKLVSFTDYLNDPTTYDNASGICIIYDTNECYAFYENQHDEQAVNGCQFACTRCGKGGVLASPVHENESVITYNTDAFDYYATTTTVTFACKYCGTVEKTVTINPIFGETKGYSVDLNNVGFLQSFYVDTQAVALYREYVNAEFDYGVVAATGTDAPLSAGNGSVIGINSRVIFKSFLNSEFKYFDIKVIGIPSNYADTAVVCCAYIFDGESVAYASEGTVTQTATGVTYNSFNKEENV